MAAGDINDALTQIPGVAIADDSVDPTDLGAGYALLKFKGGKLIWLPTGGSVRYALDTSSASQLAGLTEEASPADADLLLLERASDGAKRKVQFQNVGGGSAQAFAGAATYNSNAGQSIPNNAFTVVDYEDVEFDPDNAVTTGASWHYTAPATGRYLVIASAQLASGASWSNGEYAQAQLFVGGVSARTLAIWQADGTSGSLQDLKGAAEIGLTIGDAIDIRVFQNSGASAALSNSPVSVFCSIRRVA